MESNCLLAGKMIRFKELEENIKKTQSFDMNQKMQEIIDHVDKVIVQLEQSNLISSLKKNTELEDTIMQDANKSIDVSSQNISTLTIRRD